MSARHYYTDDSGHVRCFPCAQDDVGSNYRLHGALDVLIRDMPINWLLENNLALVLFAAKYDPKSLLT